MIEAFRTLSRIPADVNVGRQIVFNMAVFNDTLGLDIATS